MSAGIHSTFVASLCVVQNGVARSKRFVCLVLKAKTAHHSEADVHNLYKFNTPDYA